MREPAVLGAPFFTGLMKFTMAFLCCEFFDKRSARKAIFTLSKKGSLL